MKKITIILFLCLSLVGCSNEKEYQEILKEYSKTYYEKYMSGIENMEEAEITLGMLKKANEYDSNFDLIKLEKCDEETTVILTINDEKEVIIYKFDLKCN